MNLFNLFAKLTLDSSEYNKGLGDSEKSAKSFAARIGGGLKTAGKVAVAGIAAVTTAAAGMTTALAKGVAETASYGDTVDKMSQKLGLSTDAYQKWDYVLKISGSDIQSMSMGLKTLTNKFDEAMHGSKTATETFSRLGLSMEDLSGLSREEVFEKTITAFQGMEDSAERAALANDLFGRSGQELAPLFNTTAEETAELINQVEKLGGVMSNDAVKASAQFEDNLTALQTAFSGVKRSLTAEFLPGVNDVLSGFTALIMGEEGARSSLESGFGSILDSVDNVISRATDILSNIGGALLSEAPRLLEVGFSIVESLGDALLDNSDLLIQDVLDLILSAMQHLSDGKVVRKIIDGAFSIVSSIGMWLGEYSNVLADAAIDLIVQFVTALTDPEALVNLVNTALILITSLADALISAIPVLIEQAPIIIQNLVTAIVEALPLVIRAGLQLIEALSDAILSNLFPLITAAVEIVVAVVNGISQMLPELVPLGFQIIMTIFGALLDNLPQLIEGGIELIEALISGIFSMVGELTGAAMDLVGKFLQMIVDEGKKLIDKGKDLVENIKAGVMQKIEDAKQWGKDLIDNFVGGIKQKWENLKQTVSNVAGTVKSFLGFSEPEEGPLSNFHTYAPDMMELFAKGIRDNTGLVQDELDKAFTFDTPELTANINATAEDSNIMSELKDVLERLRAIEPGTLVAMIAPDMDAALGARQNARARGLA